MIPADSIGALIDEVDVHIAGNIIQAQAVYPRTSSLSEKAVVTLNYSNASPLATAIRELQSKLELQAIDVVKVSAQLLAMIDELKSSPMVDQADTIVIYKGGLTSSSW